MKTQTPHGLKTDQSGEVDVNYYIAKGQQMRSEALGEMLKSLFAHLRPAGLKMPHLPLNAHFRH